MFTFVDFSVAQQLNCSRNITVKQRDNREVTENYSLVKQWDNIDFAVTIKKLNLVRIIMY